MPLLAFQVVKRLHDREKSAWHALLFLIPLWFIVEWLKAIFMKGGDHANDYGQPPSPKSPRWRIFAWGTLLVSGVLLVLLIAAGQTFAGDLEIGQCFNSTDLLLDDISVVPCSGSWDYQVVDKIRVNLPVYPGENYFLRSCDRGDFVLFPTDETWEQGDRGVVCLSTR